ncbi:hypothetical protein EGT81_01120 [Alcaligenes faecalis]|nr:hypothetical protein EGT81_01120 [Alcaligenes faecalis]
MWSLEERVLAMGEYVEASGDVQTQAVVGGELLALTQWRAFRCGARIDLPCSHAMRILCTAFTQWRWVDAPLRKLIAEALRRIVDDMLRFSDKGFSQFDSVQQLLQNESVLQRLHKISVIGTCMLALAARALGHPSADRLNGRVDLIVTAILDLRARGMTEGVSYDGYDLDFVADWLLAQPASPLGDVEPMEMPFVWSALSKLQGIVGGMRSVLAQLDVARLRADALRVWRKIPGEADAGRSIGVDEWAQNLQAVMLRSGPADDQFAVAIGASVSPMGHIQDDSGSIVLGMRKRWWIDDPGYQQYADTTERNFTIGPTAHNTPVINGFDQAFKRAEVVSGVIADASGAKVLTLDLAACFLLQSRVKKLERTVWMLPTGDHAVVCDAIDTDAPAHVAWNWHGHSELYWALNSKGVSLVDHDMGDVLHIMSPQIVVTAASIQRLPGSRGQKTCLSSVFVTEPVAVLWVFSRAAVLPVCELQKDAFVVDGHPILLGDRSGELVKTLSLLPTEVPSLQVTAVRKGRIVTAVCHVNKKRFPGDVEFAVYLMSGELKLQVQWYSPSSQVELQIPDAADMTTLKVHGFVRNKSDHTRKLMKAVQVL